MNSTYTPRVARGTAGFSIALFPRNELIYCCWGTGGVLHLKTPRHSASNSRAERGCPQHLHEGDAPLVSREASPGGFSSFAAAGSPAD